MIWLLVPIVAFWRLWLGRGDDGWPTFLKQSDGKPFPGATYVQYAIILAAVYGIFTFTGHTWGPSITAAVGMLLLARITGHTPILYPPGAIPPADRLHGIEQLLWDSVQWMHSAETRWWSFAWLRYVIPAILWECALRSQGVDTWITVGVILLVASYRVVAWLVPGRVAYAEFIGWAWVGVALALA